MPVPIPDLGPDPTPAQILRAAAQAFRAESEAQSEPKMLDHADWYDQAAERAEREQSAGRTYDGAELSTAREIVGLDPDSSVPTTEELIGERYALRVRFTLRDEAAAAAFDGLLAPLVEGIRTEPGTWIYNIWTPEDEPLVREFYELYADRAAFEAHEAQPHTRTFLSAREQHLSSFEVTYLGDEAADDKAARVPKQGCPYERSGICHRSVAVDCDC